MSTMETLNPSKWSNLPFDVVRSLLERLKFVDFHRAKKVCSNWYSVSKQTVPQRNGSPWIMLFLEENGCMMFNPDEDKVYKPTRDFSGARFLANSGKWFLIADSRCNLYIIDVFSGDRIDLPPVESLLSSEYSLERVGEEEFRWVYRCGSLYELSGKELRGLLWVDEKTGEFVVVWFFHSPANYLCYCKKGDNNYTVIPLRDEVPKFLHGLIGVVLRGHRLYIAGTRRYIRVIDLSGHQGFQDVTESNPQSMESALGFHVNYSFGVTTAGEVLLVESTTFEGHRRFQIHKKDPNAVPDQYRQPDLVEVHSLGDEALLLDLGITVPANRSLGIKPNCIYFTRHDPTCLRKSFDLDICVFNLTSNSFEHFPHLAKLNLNLKDARWFLPVT